MRFGDDVRKLTFYQFILIAILLMHSSPDGVRAVDWIVGYLTSNPVSVSGNQTVVPLVRQPHHEVSP